MTHLNYKYKLREIAERGGNENCLNLFRTYMVGTGLVSVVILGEYSTLYRSSELC